MPKPDAHDGQVPPRMSTAARAEAMAVEDVIRPPVVRDRVTAHLAASSLR